MYTDSKKKKKLHRFNPLMGGGINFEKKCLASLHHKMKLKTKFHTDSFKALTVLVRRK